MKSVCSQSRQDVNLLKKKKKRRTCVIESKISREVNNDALAIALIQGLNVRLANTIGKSHDPAVHLSVTVQPSNVLGRQCLVDDLALGVFLEFLASKLSRRHMAKVHIRVLVQELNESLASVASGAYQANPRRRVVCRILLAEGRVGIGIIRRDGIQSSLRADSSFGEAVLSAGEASDRARGRED